MDGLIITSRGIEETASIEVKELINARCKAEEGCVVFGFKQFKELCLLCYKCQSADRVLCLIGSFEFRDFFDEIEKFIDKCSFKEWGASIGNFKVDCIRLGNHNFKSVEAGAKARELILKKIKKGSKFKSDVKADFKSDNFQIIFFVYIVNNKCYFGVDFCGFELNKRDYKIFLHPNSLRGTIAYALIRRSGFSKKEAMLDPFARDGVIPIEAAFYAIDFPHNYYKKDKFAFLKLNLGIKFDKFFEGVDKQIKKTKTGISSYDYLFKFVDYARKNAKIAGVDKQINFSRAELEWLDIKFREASLDRIISNPPASKNSNLDKIYNEFFYQSNYILKKEGTVALISRMPLQEGLGTIVTKPEIVKNYASKHNFLLLKENDVWSGEQLLKIMVFKKADMLVKL